MTLIYFKITRKPIKLWRQHYLTVNSIFVLYISKMLKYRTGNVNFHILTIGTEMFRTPGLLNGCLHGCKTPSPVTIPHGIPSIPLVT